MDMMGVEIAKMHLINLIHGDLTTSNIMVRRRSEPPNEGAPITATSVHDKTRVAQLPAELVRRFGLVLSSISP